MARITRSSVSGVTGDARVGEVWRGGSVDKVDGEGAAVMNMVRALP